MRLELYYKNNDNAETYPKYMGCFKDNANSRDLSQLLIGRELTL